MFTVRQAVAMGIDQATIWQKSDILIDSQYGKVEYIDWCARESARINRHPSRRAEIVMRVVNFSTEVAVFTDDPPPLAATEKLTL